MSATFKTAVDVDGDPNTPPTTDASVVLSQGLFGTSPCNPKTIENNLIEFADNGDFNIVCANSLTTVTKIASWSGSGSQVNLTNIIVPNPNYDDQKAENCTGNPLSNPNFNCKTVTLPLLALSDLVAQSTNGVITITTKVQLPYNAKLDSEEATLVLEKQQ